MAKELGVSKDPNGYANIYSIEMQDLTVFDLRESLKIAIFRDALKHIPIPLN